MQSMALTFHPKTLNKTGVYVRTLTISDIDKIIELENACFSEEERATPEKIRYRLTVCGELCHGLFTLSKPHPDTPKGVSDFKPKEILIAHILASKSNATRISEASMRIPKELLSKYAPNAPVTSEAAPATETTPATEEKPADAVSAEASDASQPAKTETPEIEGHFEAGETVCIHSLCVAPSYRSNGYSQILLKDYVSRMRDAGVSKRLALIAHKEYTGVYTKAGFRNLGASSVTYAGGSWIDMTYEYGSPMGKGAFRRG